ncbi:uncharacterized protein LOC129060712 [Pongo abelii]|uniref:uncharacterized protein LOC129060712 n=1 Tax=Pongo abelii TaxID=9601 RepID=UPI0023E8187C|nr:uncharacterized protein LOC129060712 [Pongo abelii]
MSQGIHVTSRKWKREGNGSSSGVSRRNQPCWHLDFSSMRLLTSRTLSSQPRRPSHHLQEPAQEAKPSSTGTSPGGQAVIYRNQPRRPSHHLQEPAQQAKLTSTGTNLTSTGTNPAGQAIIYRNQPGRPACSKPSLTNQRKPSMSPSPSHGMPTSHQLPPASPGPQPPPGLRSLPVSMMKLLHSSPACESVRTQVMAADPLSIAALNKQTLSLFGWSSFISTH